jgi:hypothetical protein
MTSPHPYFDPSRRQFLRVAAAGSVGALWSGPAGAAEVPNAKLGAGLDVPLLGMGTGVKAGNRSNALVRIGEKRFIDTIRRSYDEGVRLFDCADSCGRAAQIFFCKSGF